MSGERRFDAVVIGAVGIDTNVYLGEGDLDLSREGHFTRNVDCIGQAGGFSSRGYARLGRRVALIASVGDDFGGAWIRRDLAAEGIDVSGLFTDPAGTSRSVNMMRGDGRRRNFYDGRGAMTLRPDPAMCEVIVAQARLVHVHIVNWSRWLLPLARERGAVVAADLQDVVSASDPYRRDYVEQSDIVFFSSANHSDPRPIVDAYLRMNPRLTIVVGLGAEGAAAATAQEGFRRFPPVTMDAPVVDTNGAGDSLAVGFLVSRILERRTLEESVLRGQIAARHCCTLPAERAAELITAEALAAHVSSASR